ncbi:hypothetical protein AUEXF2481DRAFT_5693 [Aureobasidium subglaciale EXF-2481]|uniref:Secreted protein n=1 Tax=Aureobasidium subglaciale (strain EXF-2481) TaxID=1043005 RepID=A0A074YFI0_AURSE|nr:uncharacterized protein AUEXF2481DRAFT_5693 [Aureobasidium subglaciale EXF-2481]KEQ94814.1 hypothetical protein AUEXF2481DRAFT_5693 [Aureobasidium subglaciale EXF-2481]
MADMSLALLLMSGPALSNLMAHPVAMHTLGQLGKLSSEVRDIIYSIWCRSLLGPPKNTPPTNVAERTLRYCALRHTNKQLFTEYPCPFQ